MLLLLLIIIFFSFSSFSCRSVCLFCFYFRIFLSATALCIMFVYSNISLEFSIRARCDNHHHHHRVCSYNATCLKCVTLTNAHIKCRRAHTTWTCDNNVENEAMSLLFVCCFCSILFTWTMVFVHFSLYFFIFSQKKGRKKWFCSIFVWAIIETIQCNFMTMCNIPH